MAIILNIETATELCSVALTDGTRLIGYRENNEGKSHASVLTVFIDDLLKTNRMVTADLSAVAVSMGPGSYTGLRIGVSVAKGICYGAGIPLIAIPTLQIMALEAEERLHPQLTDSDLLCPMIDARRLEVYTAFFNQQPDFISDIKAEIIHADSFSGLLTDHKIYFFGNGAAKCRNIITHPNAQFLEDISPSASKMAALSQKSFENAKFEDMAYFEPFYLKDFVATIAKNKVLGPK